MKEFKKDNKMASLIFANHYLLPVIHRFGFKLGFKNKTIAELCSDYQLNTDFFLAIVNSFHNPGYFPEKKLLSFSPLLIIDYLQKTHRYYINYSLPRIENLLHKLQLSSLSSNKEMQTIEDFYLAHKKRLLNHIAEEEEKVFPYIIQLINAPETIKGQNNNINFEAEHENVDLEIDDLKNLLIKYISPEYDELVCNELLLEIFRFETDIVNHSRIEDNILIPQLNLLQNNS